MAILGGYRGWALLSVAAQAAAVVVLKMAAVECGGYFCLSLSHYYGAAVCLMVCWVIFWNRALSRGNLSDVYVFTALTPVFLLVLSVVVLDERIGITSSLGAVLISLAIYMQQREQHKTL